MKYTIEDWRMICQCPEACEEWTKNLTLWNPKKTRWYYYNGSYYSLLFNQICCIWISEGKYYFRHWNVTQSHEFIQVFDDLDSLKEYYKKILKVK